MFRPTGVSEATVEALKIWSLHKIKLTMLRPRGKRGSRSSTRLEVWRGVQWERMIGFFRDRLGDLDEHHLRNALHGLEFSVEGDAADAIDAGDAPAPNKAEHEFRAADEGKGLSDHNATSASVRHSRTLYSKHVLSQIGGIRPSGLSPLANLLVSQANRARGQPVLERKQPAGGEVEEPGVCEGTRRMPREGALVLSDLRSPTLSIVCEPCGRCEPYSVARLMERHGDAKLTDLLQTLANCPKARSAIVHDRCRAVFEGLSL